MSVLDTPRRSKRCQLDQALSHVVPDIHNARKNYLYKPKSGRVKASSPFLPPPSNGSVVGDK